MPPDDQLVLEAVSGSDDALTELLGCLGPGVRDRLSINPQHVSVVDSDDIMQVTYLEAFLRVKSFRGQGVGAFSSWLARIANNNLRDAVQALQRDKRPPAAKRVAVPRGDDSYHQLFDELARTRGTPSRVVSRREMRDAIDGVLGRMPGDYATVIQLYDLDGLTGSQVADRMSRSVGAVRMMVARAREWMASELGPESKYLSRG